MRGRRLKGWGLAWAVQETDEYTSWEADRLCGTSGSSRSVYVTLACYRAENCCWQNQAHNSLLLLISENHLSALVNKVQIKFGKPRFIRISFCPN